MSDDGSFELPLFPLRSVLFPGGLLHLKVFEARYVDLVSRCLREGTGFGVVCLREGSEVRGERDERVQFETVGVVARLDEVDAAQPGILDVRCVGTRRVALDAPAQRDDGLWLARARHLPEDEVEAPPTELCASVDALRHAVDTLAGQGARPFAEPYRYDDAGWVANRWCELLPISLAAKHKLMALDDAVLRLRLVDEFLRERGVVGR